MTVEGDAALLAEQGYLGSRRVLELVPGITYRQLDWWDRIGLVTPSVRPSSGGGPGKGRLWSRRDVVALRVCALFFTNQRSRARQQLHELSADRAVHLVRAVPPGQLAGRYLVAVGGGPPVIAAIDGIAALLAGTRSVLRVVPLGPLVADLAE